MEKIKTNKPKFIIYARKSTEGEERQAKSIEDQISTMKELAAKNHISILDIYQESRSAKEPGRPVFNLMIEKINEGTVDGILCWKLDRLARNPIDAGTIQWLLQKDIIKQIKTIERDYNPEDNVVMASIELSMANQYIRDLSKNVKRGLDQKVQRGEYPGSPPVGYLTDHKTRKLVLDPSKWKYVQEAYRLYATGMYSIESLIKKMNKNGFRTVGGKVFFPSGMHRLLLNPIYYGWFNWKEQIYKGIHPPIISKVLFDKVQEVLTPRKHKKQDNKLDFLYRGFLTCGECGLRITAELKIKHNKGNGKRHEYIYYRCTKSRGTETCSQKYVREEELMKEIDKHFAEFNFNNESVELAIEIAKEGGKKEWERFAEIEKRNKYLLDKNLALQNSLVEKFIENQIPQEIYNRKLAELRNKEAVIEDKMRSAKDNYKNVFEVIEQLASFAKVAPGILQNGTSAEKKTVLSVISSNIAIKDRKIEKITLAEPFCWLEQDLGSFIVPRSGIRAFEPLKKAFNKTQTTSKEVAFRAKLASSYISTNDFSLTYEGILGNWELVEAKLERTRALLAQR